MSVSHFSGPVAVGADSYEALGAATTLTADHNGMTYGLALVGGFTVTLPSVADAGAGWRVKFIVTVAPTTAYIITEKTADDTNVLIGGINELEVTTDDDGPYTATGTTITFAASVAVVGDFVELFCSGAKFYFSGQTNIDAGITLA
jgi:hypothetical protein